jgi:hypothetical protein
MKAANPFCAELAQNGKEEQYKAPFNSCHLVARIASGADISSDVEVLSVKYCN